MVLSLCGTSYTLPASCLYETQVLGQGLGHIEAPFDLRKDMRVTGKPYSRCFVFQHVPGTPLLDRVDMLLNWLAGARMAARFLSQLEFRLDVVPETQLTGCAAESTGMDNDEPCKAKKTCSRRRRLLIM